VGELEGGHQIHVQASPTRLIKRYILLISKLGLCGVEVNTCVMDEGVAVKTNPM
jgi:hypothetical protein